MFRLAYMRKASVASRENRFQFLQESDPGVAPGHNLEGVDSKAVPKNQVGHQQ